MRFFLISLFISAKRRIINRSAPVLLIIFALLLWAASTLLGGESTLTSVRVGLVFQSDSVLSGQLTEHLESDSVMVFEPLSLPRERVEEMVGSGELECAFFIPRSLKGSIISGDYMGAVEMVKSPRSMLDALARLRLFAALTDCISPDIAEMEIASLSGLSAGEISAYVAGRYEYYAQNYTFVETVVDWRGEADSTAPLPPPFSPARILHGLLAIFIIISVAVSLPSLITEQCHLRASLPAGRMACYWLCCILGVWLFALITGMTGLAVLWFSAPELLLSIGPQLIAVILYSGACAALGCLPALFLRSADLIFSSSVFVLLCCLILGGAIIDPAELGGLLLQISRFFLTSHYIEAATLEKNQGLGVCAVTLLLSLVAGCLLPLIRLRRKRDK